MPFLMTLPLGQIRRRVGTLMTIAAFGALLSACAVLQPKKTIITSFDMDKLRAIDAETLCADYYELRTNGEMNQAATLQIEKVMYEKGVTRWRMPAIRESTIQLGMTRNELLAAWGRPRRENETVSRAGIDIQHVYGSTLDATYVYTKNGIITSWQD